MQDLTTGPITRHLLKTTGFMLVTMLFQTLYFLIDIYWAARRAVVNVKPELVVATVTVILRLILAPFLLLGLGRGHRLGAAGAAMASLIAIVVGRVWPTAYFRKVGSFLRFDPGA